MVFHRLGWKNSWKRINLAFLYYFISSWQGDDVNIDSCKTVYVFQTTI